MYGHVVKEKGDSSMNFTDKEKHFNDEMSAGSFYSFVRVQITRGRRKTDLGKHHEKIWVA